MAAANLISLIETLDDNVDDLREILAPFLKADSTSNLPLLEKAQLYVLVTYAIESLLFSYLRLNGVNAKEHPIFRELTRVKQYFEKIKTIERGGDKRAPLSLDKDAAGRFIKNALAGNDKLDLSRAQQAIKKTFVASPESESSSKKGKADPPREIPSSAADTPSDNSSGSQSPTSFDEPMQHPNMNAMTMIEVGTESVVKSGNKVAESLPNGSTTDGKKACNQGRRHKKQRIS